jgi:hypothetical protein
MLAPFAAPRKPRLSNQQRPYGSAAALFSAVLLYYIETGGKSKGDGRQCRKEKD